MGLVMWLEAAGLIRVWLVWFAVGFFTSVANPIRVRPDHRFKFIVASAAKHFDVANSGFDFHVPAVRAINGASASGFGIHAALPMKPEVVKHTDV
jgi:hypothetical protein